MRLQLFELSAQISLQNALRIIVVEAAVVIVDLVAQKGIVRGNQRINHIDTALFSDSKDQTLVYLANVPMARNGIFGVGHIIECTGEYTRCIDKIIAHTIDVITVIDVGQIVNFSETISPECIDDDCAAVFGLTCDIVDQAAGIKEVVSFLFSRPVIF